MSDLTACFKRALETADQSEKERGLSQLLSNGPDAIKIREWIKTHSKLGGACTITLPGRSSADKALVCTGWEAEVLSLARAIDKFRGLSKWEEAPDKTRDRHTKRVADLARELAKALKENHNPGYPSVLRLFDERSAREMLELHPHKDIFIPQFEDRKWSHKENGKVVRETEKAGLLLEMAFGGSQTFPALLERLASFAESAKREPKRVLKPGTAKKGTATPQANARAFARYLAGYFKEWFNTSKNGLYEVILLCVKLMFPRLQPSPTESKIRDWVDRKKRSRKRSP